MPKRQRIETRPNTYFRDWYRRNRERIKEKARLQRQHNPQQVKAWNLKKFGITPEQYEEMFVAQCGLCAACGHPETRKSKYGLIAPLCVDHDHATNENRGLLCSRCNLALGLARDSMEVLRKLAAYLERHARS